MKLWPWHKLHPDKAKEREDKAHRDTITRLETARNDAWRERDDAIGREALARRKADTEHELRVNETIRASMLEAEAQRLHSLIRKAARELPQGSRVMAILQSKDMTDFSPLDELDGHR